VSVDVWLAQAAEVLQAQREQGLSPSSVLPWDDVGREWVLPLARFEGALAELLERLCRRPGRWILIAEDNERRHLFWQALAYEDGSLVTEVVGNHYPEGEDRWTPIRRVVCSHWDGSARIHLDARTGSPWSTRHLPLLTTLRRELRRH
jgi:hypothetical protein